MNHPDPHAQLRAAFTAGCRIQAWHLNDGAANSNDGRWDTLTPPEGREPEFGCAPHLYRVHPEDEAKALAVWDFRMPTMHQPDGVRFYIERLVSNTDPAGMVRENLLLREEVTRLSSLIAELGQEVGAVAWQWRWLGDSDEGPGPWNLCDNEAHSKLIAANSGYEVRSLYTSPAHTSEARDSERLDWIERAVTEKAAVWLLPSADHRFVQVRWSRGDIDNSPTAPNLREAIDAAMRQEGGNG